MAIWASLQSLCIALLLARPLAWAQSPGPDWPKCASVSRTYHKGWEILEFNYETVANGSSDGRGDDVVSLRLDVQNLADGSRTVCHFERESAGTVDILFEDNGGECVTAWDVKYVPFNEDTVLAEPAQVVFDGRTDELYISQGWTCRDGDELLSFSGEVKSKLDIDLLTLYPQSINAIGQPPPTIGPATVTQTNNPSLPVQDPESRTEGWQILDLVYYPLNSTANALVGVGYNVRIELRNLLDDSIVICYLTSTNDQDPLLASGGNMPGDSAADANGCFSSRLEILPDDPSEGSAPVQQEWFLKPTPEASFDTETYELLVRQLWFMDDEAGNGLSVEGVGRAVLEMECVDVDGAGERCVPIAFLLSGSSGPRVVEMRIARSEMGV